VSNSLRVLSESVVSLDGAEKLVPGKTPNHSTIYRWCIRGVLDAKGKRIKLESFRLGGGARMTSVEAVHRFLKAVNTDEKVGA
jgi:hypothetical protein